MVLVVLLTALLTGITPASGDGPAAVASAPAAPGTGDDTDDTDDPDDDTTRPTINEFFPEERPLSDCLSSLPKPDCGSEARGGWAQTTVFVAILAGLAFIAWRIVAGARRARRAAPELTARTPDPTTVPDGDGGGQRP